MDIEALERLIEPEDDSTRGGSNIFQLFDTEEKKDHFVASKRSIARKLEK